MKTATFQSYSLFDSDGLFSIPVDEAIKKIEKAVLPEPAESVQVTVEPDLELPAEMILVVEPAPVVLEFCSNFIEFILEFIQLPLLLLGRT